ncbi:MAG TPA: hypothetical protein VJO34_15770 [Methylomirabilota bacterium]|nr:hypothetical protein [Methylomirabilota bacterium]
MLRKTPLLVMILVTLLTLASNQAWALDYELWVANLLEPSLLAYLETNKSSSAEDDRLDRLSEALDSGKVPHAAFVPDRLVSPVTGEVASVFGSFSLTPTRSPSSKENEWEQFRWEGLPDNLAVFEIKGSGLQWQELRYIGVSTGSGLKVIPIRMLPLRDPKSLPGLETSTLLVDHRIERGDVGAWLRRGLDLSEGIGVVVARNTDPQASDRVYVVLRMSETPGRFKVALAWRQRIPRDGGGVRPNFKQ